MRGESGPGVPVEVRAGGKRLRLVSGAEAVGDWDVTSIGIQPLNDGFAIRAEGEEFILKTEDDSGIAHEIGIAALPAMASRSQAAHNPPPGAPVPQADRPKPLLAAIVFAFGGVLVLSGGFFLREDPTLSAASRTTTEGLQLGGRFWFAFVLGGLLIVGVGFALASGVRWARFTAVTSLVGLVLLFGVVAQNAAPEADFLLAYGFIAGGIVVGVAVLFAGSLGEAD
jgi:hypothetical protein